MGEEKRKSRRTDVNATIQLKELKEGVDFTNVNTDEIPVNIVNISEDGLAFTTKEVLVKNSIYDTKVVLTNGEKFEAIIEIVRIEKADDGSDETVYGCRFIGINTEDRFKIQVYQILFENGRI